MLPSWSKQVRNHIFQILNGSETRGINSSSFGVPLLSPAPRFGAFFCDTPWNLANAVMHAIGPLTGTASGENNGGAGDIFIRLELHRVAYIGNRKQKSLHNLHW